MSDRLNGTGNKPQDEAHPPMTLEGHVNNFNLMQRMFEWCHQEFHRLEAVEDKESPAFREELDHLFLEIDTMAETLHHAAEHLEFRSGTFWRGLYLATRAAGSIPIAQTSLCEIATAMNELKPHLQP
jgi:hypothetical protein